MANKGNVWIGTSILIVLVVTGALLIRDITSKPCAKSKHAPASAKAARVASEGQGGQASGGTTQEFVFTSPQGNLRALTLEARISPVDGDQVHVVNLSRAFFQTPGKSFRVAMQGSGLYNLEIVNGNPHLPLRLNGVKGGEYELRNDESVVDLSTGRRYVLSGSEVYESPDAERKHTPAFTPAYNRCYTSGVLHRGDQQDDNEFA